MDWRHCQDLLVLCQKYRPVERRDWWHRHTSSYSKASIHLTLTGQRRIALEHHCWWQHTPGQYLKTVRRENHPTHGHSFVPTTTLWGSWITTKEANLDTDFGKVATHYKLAVFNAKTTRKQQLQEKSNIKQLKDTVVISASNWAQGTEDAAEHPSAEEFSSSQFLSTHPAPVLASV